jgi:hypothetical protein
LVFGFQRTSLPHSFAHLFRALFDLCLFPFFALSVHFCLSFFFAFYYSFPSPILCSFFRCFFFPLFLTFFCFSFFAFYTPFLPPFPPLCLLSFSVFRLLLLSPPPLSIQFFLFIFFLAFNPFSMLTPFTFFSPLTYMQNALIAFPKPFRLSQTSPKLFYPFSYLCPTFQLFPSSQTL